MNKGKKQPKKRRDEKEIIDVLCGYNAITGCILVLNSKADRHARFNWNGKEHKVYRHIYERCYGELLQKEAIHHICGNKKCINPLHLQAMSAKEHAKLHEYRHLLNFFNDKLSPVNKAKLKKAKEMLDE
jgi:hypothetical protein